MKRYFDYAGLSHRAKQNGGPTKYEQKLLSLGYRQRIRDEKEVFGLSIIGLILGAGIEYTLPHIQKIIKKYRQKEKDLPN